MQRFKSILVVVDEGTENRAVVERAVILAQRNQAHLTIANTVKALPPQVPRPTTPEPPVEDQELGIDIVEEWPPVDGLPSMPQQPLPPEKPLTEEPEGAGEPAPEATVVIREHIVEEESQRLEQWVDFVQRSGVPVTGKILYGTPFLEIIREVLRNEHDLLMTAPGGRGGLRERLFGSTAMHLLRKCPCPVWLVRDPLPEPHTCILAAVDPAPPDEEQYAINIKIMDLATALARRQKCKLVVVHTWTFPAEQSLRSGYLVASGELDGWLRKTHDLHRRRLTELLRRYPLQDLETQVYMLKGEPGRLIPEVAERVGVELIVMGTVSRTGVAGLLMGTTAERILRRVGCSVLAVKPDGFVSPVTLEEPLEV